MKKPRRYFAALGAGAFFAFFLTILLLAVTGAGQRVMLRVAAWAASSEALSVRIGRLEGSLFSEGRIARVALSDADGTWAEISGIEFSWSPWSLFGGAVNIDTINIGKAHISRTPKESADAANGQSNATDGGGFVIPPLRLGSLTIGEAVFGEPVFGEAARFSVNGWVRASDPEDTASGAIAINDLDRPGFIKATVGYRAKTGALEITAEAEEKAGGVLSSLLDIEDSAGLRLTLDGKGPIDAWRGDWSLVAAGGRLASGALILNRDIDGLRVAAEASGEIARFVPAPYAAVLAGNSDLRLEARILGDERYRLEQFQLDAPRVKAEASGEVDLGSGRIEGRAEAQLRNSTSDEPISLTLTDGGKIELRNAAAVFSAKPDREGVALSGRIEASDVAAQGNRAERITLSLSARQSASTGGLMERLEGIALSAVAENVEPADPVLKPVAGGVIAFKLNGSKSGSRLMISDSSFSSVVGTASATGSLDADGFDGDITLAVPDAAPFSELAGRDLSGALVVTAKGQTGFDGALNLTVDGQAERIDAGADLLARLLVGKSSVGGKLARDAGGALQFDALAVRTEALSLDVDGHAGDASSDLKISGRMAELGQLLPNSNSSGALRLDAAIEGEGEAQKIAVALSAAEAVIRDKPVRDLVISYEGRGGTNAQRGVFSADGQIDGSSLKGTGQLAFGGPEGTTIREFELMLGDNRIEADAALPATGEARGTMRLHLVDAAQLAPILGVPMEGSATLDAQLSGSAELPRLVIKADAGRLRFDTLTLEGFTAAFDIADALARPVISGNAQITTLAAGESRITDLKLSAKPDADRTVVDLSARIDNRWQVGGEAVTGLLAWQPDAALRNISVRSGSTILSQEGTARLTAGDDGLRLEGLVLAAGKGRIAATIAMDEALSGKIEVKQFPAGFAALFTPGMEPRGAVDGVIDLGGSTAAPEVSYKFSWHDASVAGPLPPAFPALNLSATGTLIGDDLKIDAAASGPDGLSLKANGVLHEASTAASLDLKAKGSVPLGLAGAFLSARGTRLTGSAAVDLAISGPTAKPIISGGITASGASLSDPASGVDLKDANLTARLSGGTLRIETLTARSEKGGNLNASGTIGMVETAVLPVDLQIKAVALQFNDQRVVAGKAGGDVALKGDLNGNSKLSGAIDIARLDIQIPQSMPASVEALELKHKNAPEHVAAVQPIEKRETKSSLPSAIGLSLTLRSANRIFVKGRGLDAQLGGELQLLGSADEPRAIGEFTLQRGLLALLGRTLQFTSGSVNFSGDLDPVLNFLATTDVEGTRIEVTVSGQASDPKFGFASNPELPEDEILALLLFNKSLGELSLLQIAQLASEVSELGGLSGGPGILGRLKASVGIDTLNVTTDKDGEAAVSAGSYLNENVFVGVEQGSSSDSSRVKVDLDITKNLKLRGEAGADGNSKLGFGVEWEY